MGCRKPLGTSGIICTIGEERVVAEVSSSESNTNRNCNISSSHNSVTAFWDVTLW
jgi:hypothetical protein